MTRKEKIVLGGKICNEGFDYCFDGYSDWLDIVDPVFHLHREQYLQAKADFQEYLNSIGVVMEEEEY